MAVTSTVEAALWSERPLIFLAAQIAFVQAANYLLGHRGIGCCRDSDAVLRDDLTAPRLDRKMLRSERQAPVGPVRTLPGFRYASKKLNSTRSKHGFPP